VRCLHDAALVQITVDKPLGLTLAEKKGGDGGVVVQARVFTPLLRLEADADSRITPHNPHPAPPIFVSVCHTRW